MRPAHLTAPLLAILLSGCLSEPPEPEPPTLGDWQALPDAPFGIAEVGIAQAPDAFWMIGGFTAAGGGANTNLRFDGEWSIEAPYPLPIHHVQTAFHDGTVYAFGGFVSGALQPGTFIAGAGPAGWPRTDLAFKHVAGNQWEPISPLPEARAGGAAVTIDDRIYIVGGMPESDTPLTPIHIYDPATDTYTQGAPIPVGRDHLNVLAHEGLLYAVSGRAYQPGGTWQDLSDVDIYDPVDDAWRPGAPVPIGRGGQGGAVVGDCIILAGGERATGEYMIYDHTDIYHIPSDTWHPGPALPAPSHGMGMATLGGDIVLAGGGGEGPIKAATLSSTVTCGSQS